MDTLTRMRAFVDVVEAEGYSAAARKIGRSKALLSKYVRELEDELGVLLLNRTTRQFSLTQTGHEYYRKVIEILREIDSLSESIRDATGDIRGRIKLSAPRSFADAAPGRSLIDFAIEHPDIELDIHLDDRFVDMVEDGFDLAIRITRLDDSSLIARKLAPFSVPLVASPELIERVGMPERPEDLQNLPCIIDTNSRYRNNWRFLDGEGGTTTVAVNGRLEVNSPLAVCAAAKAGLGFALLPEFVATAEVEAGHLMRLFDDRLTDGAGIYAVYPHRRYLPAKVRTLVDYLAHWLKNNCGGDR
ncbi:LysR family transcriptional regulator [Nitratireductor sp. CH_MIT9313-5]|uniref:LysR family transcriptional regulator n=1 Tax=Nitratireductor sp. CH_MIT9313-5 TaxID=3107764 RepID=UPI003009F7E6